MYKNFHKQTDATHAGIGIPKDLKKWPKDWTTVFYKEYPRMQQVSLPAAGPIQKGFEETLRSRTSIREYDEKTSLPLETLSSFLACAAGLKSDLLVKDKSDDDLRTRHYPSGGARYPLEIYLLAQRIEGLEKKIYHYNVKKHALEKLFTEKELEKCLDALSGRWKKTAPLHIIITSRWNRSAIKYKDLCYRLALLEAGHLGQNICLTGTALGLDSCPFVGFDNSKIDEALDIHHDDNEGSLYVFSMGFPKDE